MHRPESQKAQQPPRMLWWLVATLVLMLVASYTAKVEPGGLLAVSLYKCHLMSLGGWGGYWLDRALFPYARPHLYLADELSAEGSPDGGVGVDAVVEGVIQLETAHDYPLAMLRRAVIVAACLVCVGLGA